MNKKFLSTLLTVAATSLTLNAAPVAKTRAKVVEVEMAPAKWVEFKLSPQRIIGSKTIGGAIESGFSNLALNIHGEYAYLKDHTLSMIPKYKLPPFEHSGFNAGIDLTYYAKENRRSGLYWTLGADFTMGKYYEEKKDEKGNLVPNNKYTSGLSAHLIMGHKVEIFDFLYLSNSIEISYLVYLMGINKTVENVKEANKGFVQINRDNDLLSNIRVNLIEIRFAI